MAKTRRAQRLDGQHAAGVGCLWKAEVETRNFHFEAYGFDPTDAVDTLRATWERHKNATDATLDWEEDLLQDVTVQLVWGHNGYCDGEFEGYFGPKKIRFQNTRTGRMETIREVDREEQTRRLWLEWYVEGGR